MPKLVSLKVVADLEFFKDSSADWLPPEQSFGTVLLSLSLAKIGGAVPNPNKFSVTLIPITFASPQLGTIPEVKVDDDLANGDRTEGFYLLSCLRTDTESGQWVNGVYVFGVKVKLTEDGINYVGQTLVRFVVG